jgi:hypothetical protein
LHSGESFRYGRVCDFDALDADNLKAYGLEMFDVSLLVRRAALSEDLEQRVPYLGLCESAFGDGAIKYGEVSAVQVPDKITGTKYKCRPRSTHSKAFNIVVGRAPGALPDFIQTQPRYFSNAGRWQDDR